MLDLAHSRGGIPVDDDVLDLAHGREDLACTQLFNQVDDDVLDLAHGRGEIPAAVPSTRPGAAAPVRSPRPCRPPG